MLSEALQELRQHFDVNDLNDVNGYIVHARRVVVRTAAILSTTSAPLTTVPKTQ